MEDVIAFRSILTAVPRWAMIRENTRRVLADMIHHPNAGGVLVLGFGCETTNIPVHFNGLHRRAMMNREYKFLQCQDVEGEMEEAMKLIEELAAYAGTVSRERLMPAS